MSIEVFSLLVSSLVPDALGAATAEPSLGDTHSLPLLMMLAVAPGLLVLVILGICQLGGSRNDDEPDPTAEPPLDAKADELTRFTRDTIEQLNGIAVALRDTIPEAGRAPGQEPPATKGLPRPYGRNDEGSSATAGPVAERVGSGDESASRRDLLLLGSAFEAMRSVTHDEALAQLATKMHKLTELANCMQDERLALQRDAMDPQPAASAPAPSRHYLTFALGDEQFAVSTRRIQVVVEAVRLVAEPSMPPKIRKAIRLSGALVPVIDLGARFGGQPIELGWNSRIVVLDVTGGDRLQLIGLVVDTVGKVLEIPRTEIEPATASGSRIRDDFTLGTTTVDNRPVTLLDIDRGFSANELGVLRSADQAPEQESAPA